MSKPRGLYSRGYLPHYDAGSEPQFVTWRLADSIPAKLIEQWRSEFSCLEEGIRKREMYRRCENYMDQGHGSCLLRNPAAARIVQEALFFYHGKRFVLHRWVVMPNHVHVLLTPCEGVSLEGIFKPLKSYSSSAINKMLGRSGQLWQYDFFDRLMRDEGHFDRTGKYIEWNSVKARLCADPKRWPMSSANPVALEKLQTIPIREQDVRGPGCDEDHRAPIDLHVPIAPNTPNAPP